MCNDKNLFTMMKPLKKTLEVVLGDGHLEVVIRLIRGLRVRAGLDIVICRLNKISGPFTPKTVPAPAVKLESFLKSRNRPRRSA